MWGSMKGSSLILSAKSEVVVTSPFVAPDPTAARRRGAYVIRRDQMARMIRLDLVDDADRPETLPHGDDIAAVVAAARRQDHLVEASLLVGPGDDFLRFAGIDLVDRGRVALHQPGELAPVGFDALDEAPVAYTPLSMRRPSPIHRPGTITACRRMPACLTTPYATAAAVTSTTMRSTA
jgi:hypothetical protein